MTSTIKNLELMTSIIEDQNERIKSLESDIDRLKSFIKAAIELGPLNNVETKGWEVMNVLAYWVSDEPTPDN
jgi:hypothetical protein